MRHPFTCFMLLAPLLPVLLSIAHVPPPPHAYVALTVPDPAPLDARLQRLSHPLSPEYGRWLTAAQVATLAHPPAAQQDQVTSWLRRFNVTRLEQLGDAIKVWASSDTLQAMWGGTWTAAGCLAGYIIPPALQGLVDFVELCRKPFSSSGPSRAHGSMGVDDRFLGRETLQRLYAVPDMPAGPTVSAAAIEYQDNGGFSNGDLTAQQVWNEQALHNVTHVVGQNYGADTESELDVQMLSQAADGATVWFWNSPKWLYALAVELLAAPHPPQVVSMSWGWAQDRQCDIIECGANLTSQQYVNRVNFEYLKLALRGITVVVASGDAGAPGRTNEECQDASRPVNPVFPGASPYVLSVGATVLQASNATLNFSTPLCQQHGCPTGSQELALSFETVGWTGGGGFDRYSPMTPWWQADAVARYLSSGTPLPPSFHRQGRAYPDVSAVGHSCPTVLGGQLSAVDGTSCSAPVVAGLVAWLNSRRDTPLGFMNPLLYHLETTCPTCFHDVQQGHNWCTEAGCCSSDFGFAAAPGWDPVTGLGSLNVSAVWQQQHTRMERSTEWSTGG